MVSIGLREGMGVERSIAEERGWQDEGGCGIPW
jgi:hypothetical protein